MINTEDVKYPPTSIDDIKDIKLKAHLKSVSTIVDEVKDKKISEFEESVRKFSNDKKYKLTNVLLRRHFLIKAIQEENKELIEKKKIFRVDLSYDAGLFFHDQIKFYWKKVGCYNDDGTISKFRLKENHYILDVIIKKHTNDKTLIFYPKELKTNLPVLYLDV